ncbi:uncharacterized protein RAG0_00526 [Rhynchosporium agropyri]|uniref:Uncharacterized protein n=1 Tax=Rhynchosporium agropyri TaxID=914238 RepID=A0A1E1JT52_9HELO|nr:uncharacterized protein RAG0_00526 [Rhynchosporium agropyri]
MHTNQDTGKDLRFGYRPILHNLTRAESHQAHPFSAHLATAFLPGYFVFSLAVESMKLCIRFSLLSTHQLEYRHPAPVSRETIGAGTTYKSLNTGTSEEGSRCT